MKKNKEKSGETALIPADHSVYPGRFRGVCCLSPTRIKLKKNSEKKQHWQHWDSIPEITATPAATATPVPTATPDTVADTGTNHSSGF